MEPHRLPAANAGHHTQDAVDPDLSGEREQDAGEAGHVAPSQTDFLVDRALERLELVRDPSTAPYGIDHHDGHALVPLDRQAGARWLRVLHRELTGRVARPAVVHAAQDALA